VQADANDVVLRLPVQLEAHRVVIVHVLHGAMDFAEAFLDSE